MTQLLDKSLSSLSSSLTSRLDKNLVNKALDKEETYSYMAPTGRYWEVLNEFDPIKLREIDDLWLNSLVK
jgi:DNA-binding transcriptional regulator GbsR (MarR family)